MKKIKRLRYVMLFIALLGSVSMQAQQTESALKKFDEAYQVSIFSSTRDNEGHIYVAGVFSDSLVIDGKTYYSRGLLDIFVARLNASGEIEWFKHAGGANLDYFKYIETDQDDNVYISGLFHGQLVFGDTTIFAHDRSRYFTAKYTPNGELLWVRKNLPIR